MIQTAKRSALFIAIAAGQSVREVARQHSVAERTVRRWLCSPKAQKVISRYRSQITSTALGRLNEGLLAAADTLVDLLKADSEQTRLGAARTIIESVVRLREVTEFEDRLRYLEERDAERKARA
jgi:hypothetical protein